MNTLAMKQITHYDIKHAVCTAYITITLTTIYNRLQQKQCNN